MRKVLMAGVLALTASSAWAHGTGVHAKGTLKSVSAERLVVQTEQGEKAFQLSPATKFLSGSFPLRGPPACRRPGRGAREGSERGARGHPGELGGCFEAGPRALTWSLCCSATRAAPRYTRAVLDEFLVWRRSPLNEPVSETFTNGRVGELQYGCQSGMVTTDAHPG